MRHGDTKVTPNHCRHVVADAERAASAKLFRSIGALRLSTSSYRERLIGNSGTGTDLRKMVDQ